MSLEMAKRLDEPAKNKITPSEQLLKSIMTKDEMLDKAGKVEKEKKMIEKSLWFERSEENLGFVKEKKRQEAMKGELQLSDVAWKRVRKVALKQQFDRENEMYDKELESIGKTFQRDRI